VAFKTIDSAPLHLYLLIKTFIYNVKKKIIDTVMDYITFALPVKFHIRYTSVIAGQKIVKALKCKGSVKGPLKLYLWSFLLTFNEQQIIGLCKSLMLNEVNFSKVGNG
jgi:hypothetical protein